MDDHPLRVQRFSACRAASQLLPAIAGVVCLSAVARAQQESQNPPPSDAPTPYARATALATARAPTPPLSAAEPTPQATAPRYPTAVRQLAQPLSPATPPANGPAPDAQQTAPARPPLSGTNASAPALRSASLAQSFDDFVDSEIGPWLAPTLPARHLGGAQFTALQDRGGQSDSGGKSDSTNDDVESLRRRVQALEEQTRKSGQSEKREASKPGGSRSFEHNLFGRIQADTVTFGQSPGNIAQVGHAPNGTDFRRIRIGMQGTGHDIYFYRFEVDFAQPDKVTSVRPRVTDAYTEVRQLPFGTVRMGEFRVPLSIERITSANDLTFIERGLPQAFNPARELGIMAYGSTQNYFFSSYSDISTFQATNEAEQFGKAGRVDLTQRIVCLPWYDEPSEGRYLFHVGGAYQYQNSRNASVKYSTTPEAVLQYDNIRNIIPNFISTGSIAARDVQILQGEASTVLGPLSFQAEYYGVLVKPTVGSGGYSGSYFFSGWYVEGSYFLTGENRKYDREQALYTAVTPFTNFFRVRGDRGIMTGPGAWQLAARVSQMNLSDRAIQGGLLNDVTLGLNWYLTKQMRVMFNYIYAVNNVHNKQTYADIFSTRAQVVW